MAQVMVFVGIVILGTGWFLPIVGGPPSSELKALEMINMILISIGVIIGGAAWKYVFSTPQKSGETKAQERRHYADTVG